MVIAEPAQPQPGFLLNWVETALALEIIADMALKTFALNPGTPSAPPHLLDKHFLRKHGPGAYYGQPASP